MTLDMFTGGLVATNAYLIENEGTTLLIDAPAGVFHWLEEKNIQPDHLLLTHQHYDHVEDAHRFKGPTYAFSPYSSELTIVDLARSWGMPVDVPEYQISTLLENESTLQLGPFSFELLYVPGHSPDSLVFHLPQSGLAFVGDTLFSGGIGRTDLPGGNHSLLEKGIKEKLLSLPPETKIFPGHGLSTSPAIESALF